MASILAWIAVILGFILVVDSFTTIQFAVTGAQQTFFNFFEFIIGVIFIGIGIKVMKMK